MLQSPSLCPLDPCLPSSSLSLSLCLSPLSLSLSLSLCLSLPLSLSLSLSLLRYTKAQLGVGDIDFFGLYDCFPICLIRAIEAVHVPFSLLPLLLSSAVACTKRSWREMDRGNVSSSLCGSEWSTPSSRELERGRAGLASEHSWWFAFVWCSLGDPSDVQYHRSCRTTQRYSTRETSQGCEEGFSLWFHPSRGPSSSTLLTLSLCLSLSLLPSTFPPVGNGGIFSASAVAILGNGRY
jgi:hypothetical protein